MLKEKTNPENIGNIYANLGVYTNLEEAEKSLKKGKNKSIRWIEVIQYPQSSKIKSQMNKKCPEFGDEVVFEGTEELTVLYKRSWCEEHFFIQIVMIIVWSNETEEYLATQTYSLLQRTVMKYGHVIPRNATDVCSKAPENTSTIILGCKNQQASECAWKRSKFLNEKNPNQHWSLQGGNKVMDTSTASE